MMPASPRASGLSAPLGQLGAPAAAISLAFAGAGLAALVFFFRPLSPFQLLAVCVGCVIGAYLIVRLQKEPFLGTQLVFLMLPVTIPILGDIGRGELFVAGGMSFFNVRIGQLIVLAALIALGLRALRGQQVFVHSGMRKIFWLYIGTCLLSVANSQFPMDSLRFMVKFLFVNVALYLVIVNTVKRREHLERLFIILCGGGMVVALSGFAQLVAYYGFGLNWFYLTENPSPTAFFTEYGWYGIYLSLMISFAIPFYLSPAYRAWRNLVRTLLVVAFVGVAISLNRGAWIATLVACGVAVLTLRPRIGSRQLAIALSIVMLGMLGVTSLWLFAPQWERLENRLDFSGGSTVERLAWLVVEFDSIVQHPWIGNGVGTHGNTVLPGLAEYLDYEVPVWRGGSSFNIFVASLFDTGLLGLMVLVFFLYKLGHKLESAKRKVRGEADRAYLEGCALALVCLLTNSQFNPVFTADFAWALVALAVVASNISMRTPGLPPLKEEPWNR